MALWKLKQLKRWWEKSGKGGDGSDAEPQDEQAEEQDGEPGDEGGDDAGDEGEAGEGAGDEGGEEGGEDGEGGEGGEPGDGGEGGGEGDGGEGEGGAGRGKGGGKPLDPKDFQKLGDLDASQLRDPNVKAENVAGESSTPLDGERSTPVVIMDPMQYPIMSGSPESGTQSTQAWQQKLKTIRVAALRLALRRLMQRSDFAGRESGLRSGRLSGRGVNRLLQGSSNVFERRYEVEGENVAVSLLIDRSGSMSGPKMQQAADVALLIGETAANAGAKLEVVAFDSSYAAESRAAIEENLTKETGVNTMHARHNGAWLYGESSAVYVCKAFANPIGHLRRMYTTMRHMANGGTHDASALKWAGERLLKQDANRKIVFVIADGEGDSDLVFKHVVNELEQKGIVVIGLGIGCTHKFVRRFTNAIVLNDPADLCSKAFGLLIGTIAKAKGFA